MSKIKLFAWCVVDAVYSAVQIITGLITGTLALTLFGIMFLFGFILLSIKSLKDSLE